MHFRDASRESLLALCAISWCLLTAAAAPADPVPAAAPSLCLEQLACMTWCDLEQLYRQASAGTIPAGYTRGRAIYCPGAALTPARAKISQVMWHGKHFCCADCTLINQWCFGRAVRARVSYGDSWLDGKPSIVMDYRGTSHVVWSDVRDEIREVAPGLYVGLMYQARSCPPRMKMFFALELTPSCH
jgi:hypothetical protein